MRLSGVYLQPFATATICSTNKCIAAQCADWHQVPNFQAFGLPAKAESATSLASATQSIAEGISFGASEQSKPHSAPVLH